MLGAIETPSIHCLLDNTCWAISSPTELGMLIREILKRITKAKKIFTGERFFSPFLKEILYSFAEIMGEMKRKVKKPTDINSKIANTFGVEYRLSQEGSLLLSRLNLKASKKHQ